MNSFHRFLSFHLLSFFTLFFILGIAGGRRWQAPGQAVLLVSLAVAGAVLTAYLRGRPRFTLPLLLCFAFCLGFFRAGIALLEPLSPRHIFHQISREQESVLICTLQRLPGFNGEKTTLVVDLHSLRFPQNPAFITASGLVQLKLKEPPPADILPGDLLAIRARLDRPRPIGNPGNFDYPAFLAGEGIHIIGWIKSPLHIYHLPSSPSLLHRLHYLPERLRARIASFIDQTLPPEQGGIYKALLIGESSGISPEVLENFKGTGCMHILSISGAHLSILAGFLFLVFYWLLRRSEYLILRYPVKKIAAVLCLLPLTLYTLLAGAATPVLRSLIMVTAFMVALCADRQKSLFTPLALAALLILAWDPASLFTASFQLSFLAVASMIVLVPFLPALTLEPDKPEGVPGRAAKKILHYTGAALTVSLAVTIGTAPLLLFHFNRLALITPVANLPVEALICLWSLPVGFIAIPLIFLAPSMASLLLQTGAFGLGPAMKLTSLFNSLPFAGIWLPTPSPLLFFLYYGALLLLISGRAHSRRTWTAILAVWGMAVFLLIVPPAELFKGRITASEITFLNVGQGSSTFLELPGGRRLLIDGGNNSTTPGFNAGEDIIAPFLWHRGIKRLDAIVITHSDSDHYNGIPFLLSHFHPQRLWVNELSGHDERWAALLGLAGRLGIAVKIAEPEEIIGSGKEAALVNIGNPLATSETSSNNDRSLVLRFAHGPLSCLIAGDITHRAEEQLVADNPPLQSMLLLAPHHGSATSSSEAFLRAVHPRTMIVSAGPFHPEHFPAPEVRQRCELLGIALRNTADEGAISYSTARMP